jgi:hypothetical protein
VVVDTALSLSRITSREHEPSDFLVGSALGTLIGRYVGDIASRPNSRSSFAPSEHHSALPERQRASATGSIYVPLDSWIYTALDRLASFGLIGSQTSGLWPWTRKECHRQTLEAEESLRAVSRSSSFVTEAGRIVSALQHELGSEVTGIVLQSVYTRHGVISGPVLNDSFHFGETWSNDQGRAYGRGLNSYTGLIARAESGRFFAALQGEFQHAPGDDPYPDSVRRTIAHLDGIPVPEAADARAVDRLRAVEAYAGVRVGDIQFSAGKQALWWGPTYDSPLSFGANAEPTKNFKISTVEPVRVGRVGVRGEFVMGKLGGQQYTWRPWFNAQKLSIKLTENLEMGFTRWSIFWGVGHPITAGNFVRNFTSLSSPSGEAGVGRNDPGDRKGGFDFRYRLPGLRNWLTLYSDSYSDDDPSPLAAPRRAAINPGLYLARVPGLPRLDLRVEAPSTQPMGSDRGGQFIYFNNQYRSGNTNYGELLGNPVGRDGRALQGCAGGSRAGSASRRATDSRKGAPDSSRAARLNPTRPCAAPSSSRAAGRPTSPFSTNVSGFRSWAARGAI